MTERKPILVELPWPPSVNSYWRHIVRGRRAVVLLSARGREYQEQVGEYVLYEAGKLDIPLSGRLSVIMILHAPTKRKYDIDNRVKAVLDGLQHAGVFLDDEQIDHLEVIRSNIRPGKGAVWVQIIEEMSDGPG